MRNFDRLNLNQNHIRQLPSNTFRNMQYLRYLGLVGNELMDLERDAFKILQGNIFTVDVSENNFNSVDVTNVFRAGTFCKLWYREYRVAELVNKNSISVDGNVQYGPGDIYIINGSQFDFRVFDDLGYDDTPDLFSKHLGSFVVDNTSLTCDCYMVPPLIENRDFILIYVESLKFNFICERPENVKGLNLSDLMVKETYSDLVCDLWLHVYRCPVQKEG